MLTAMTIIPISSIMFYMEGTKSELPTTAL